VCNLGQFCLKVTTGNNRIDDDQGYIKIWVDHGAGYQAAATSDDKYGFNSIVLDECYFTFVSLQVQNTNNDGWGGAISFSIDGGATYVSMECVTGCGGSSPVRTEYFSVDGNGERQCKDGKICTIKPRKYHAHARAAWISVRIVS
jgi:hypothetical protein